MAPMVLLGFALVAGVAVWAGLTFTRLRNSQSWLATVTPLASIIGSGFLVCGPLLAREFGVLAAPAMAVLLAFAYAVGAVIRFNIAEAEPFLAKVHGQHPVAWIARGGQAMLAAAYAVSVAYYLKLLALFSLRPLGLDQELPANILVTVILALLGVLSFTGGLRRVERVAEASVSAKLGLIAAMLVALALAWSFLPSPLEPAPPAHLRPYSLLLLLGLLITVQGFETSRYMGESFDAPTRVRTMRRAQWIAAGIYMAFLILLTPRMGEAADTQGVAGVLDVMSAIVPALGGVVLAAAVASQLSAAVADSIGSTGIAVELSRRRLTLATGFLFAAALSVLVTWLTDAVAVIAVASRAFALYYAIQCAVAVGVARAAGKATPPRIMGIVAVGILCLVAAVAGAPAEG
ncbi:MAG: hypothetical protein ACOY45_05280 [Pseudomonadota bacterium]